MKISSLEVSSLSAFQGVDVKEQTEKDRANLEESITRHGLQVPLFVWEKGGKHLILDGHHRAAALKSLGVKKASCILINANNKKEAKKFYALCNSKFSKINKQNYLDFINDLSKEIDFNIDLNLSFDLKNIFKNGAEYTKETGLQSFNFFPYFGGKSSLAEQIVEIIPGHDTYVEPFVGGGAVFWKKPPSRLEVINDKNKLVTNFYEVCKSESHFKEFAERLNRRAFSEHYFIKTKKIKEPAEMPCTETALDFYYSIVTSFSYTGDGLTTDPNLISAYRKRVGDLLSCAGEITERLDGVLILNRSAESLIKRRSKDANVFYFIDPPYPAAAHSYYSEYSYADYENLIKLLGAVKGKFVLTTYLDSFLRKEIEKGVGSS